MLPIVKCCVVYFGGLNQLFFNPRVERTMLDSFVGTVSVFLFPFLIYFCIFSLMVRSILQSLLSCTCVLAFKVNISVCGDGCDCCVQVAGMVAIFYSLRQHMDEEIQEHRQLLSGMKV